ncbi:hypothetical protein NVP1161O_194 [Vibrio phage 1.161.O._10N.261.48.C5]|nr:hypothetical protein NVP1161O_194 [Vibrio phage 1.161.O._10N.261.48.C5]
MDIDIYEEGIEDTAKAERNIVHNDLTQLLSESVDLKDFHDKMALYFNEEE